MTEPWKRKEVIGDCTLYLGDCLEVLPTLQGVDAVVSDPPYGVNHKRGRAGNRGKGLTKGSRGILNDATPFDPAPFLAWPAILWGANHFAQRLPHGRWLMWDKTLGAGSGDFSQFEVAWFSKAGADRIIRHMWMGVQRDSEVGLARLHDTQKPIAVMEWCLGFVPQSRVILDPFMGSATTAIACIKQGRQFVGIELDEGYFEIACKRIRAAYAQPDMFVSAPTPQPEQLSILDGEA